MRLVAVLVNVFLLAFVSTLSVGGVITSDGQVDITTDLSAPALLALSSADGGDVYDGADNALYHNPVTGFVHTANGGIVYDSDSAVVLYSSDTQEFFNSCGSVLALVERSLDTYYVSDGTRVVRSIGMDDDLYMLPLSSDPDDMILATRVWVAGNSGDVWRWLFAPWTLDFGRYVWYSLNGSRIDSAYFDDRNSLWVGDVLWRGVSTGKAMQDELTSVGTLQDLLIAIVIERTETGYDGYATDVITGQLLLDVDGLPMIISDTSGQLLDTIGKPVVGADAYPVLWSSSANCYVNWSGDVLSVGVDGRLYDGDMVVRSTAYFMRTKRVYELLLIDGVTWIIAQGKTLSTDPLVVQMYDFAGQIIDTNMLSTFVVDEEEWYIWHPDDRPKEGLDVITAWFESLTTWFDDLIGYAGQWLHTWGVFVLLCFVSVITIPVWLPLVLSLVITMVKGLVVALVWTVRKPFELIGLLAGGKGGGAG